MIEKLLEYQKADAQAREIEKTLTESEDRKKYAVAKKYLDGVVENVNKLDLRAAELLSAYEQATNAQVALKEQEKELTQSLENSDDENSINFLLKKVEELIVKIKTLGKQATSIEQEIKALAEEYSAIVKKTKAAQEQYKVYGEKYNELKKSLKDKKEAVDAELENLKGSVDGALMDMYLRKRAGKMYPIVFEIRGNSCGACNMELSGAEIDKLKKGEVIECGNCGRMLYKNSEK